MRMLLPLLITLPAAAWADWAPRPAMFDYGATFEGCLLDPAAADPTTACADDLAAAYALKRAVARAAVLCGPEPLGTCAAPFEDEGLPAIAVRIAVDAGCEASDITAWPDGAPLPPDHCIAVAADIMIDEGVVPLDASIACGVSWVECGELAEIHATLWVNAVDALAPDDPAIDDLQARNANECLSFANESTGWTADLGALDCIADRAAELWADLAQEEE